MKKRGMYGNFIFSFSFSIPKFRKGILALLTCQDVSTIYLDSPIQNQKKYEIRQNGTNMSWPTTKKRPKPRVRFESDDITLDSFNEIYSASEEEDTPEAPRKYQNRLKKSKKEINSESQNQVSFDIETVVIMSKSQENGRLSKLIKFSVGNVQKYEIALLHPHDNNASRRTSL